MRPFFLSLLAASVFALTPAHAGFTLVSPDQQEAVAAPAPAPLPQSTVNRVQVGPSVVELAPAPVPPAPMAAPVAAPALPPAPAMAPTPVALPLAPKMEAPVRGFGKDIPLVIAAQQIAPADRQIAFSPGVDPSMPVSWKGGNAWRSVLADALAPRGLQVAEQGNILFISQSNSMMGAQKASLLNNRPQQEVIELSPPPVPQQMAMPQPQQMPQPVPMPQPVMAAPQPMTMVPPVAPPVQNQWQAQQPIQQAPFAPAPEMVKLPPMTMPPAAPAPAPQPVMAASQPIIPAIQPIQQPQPQALPVTQSQPIQAPVVKPLAEPVAAAPIAAPVAAPAPVAVLPEITQAPPAAAAASMEAPKPAVEAATIAEVRQWRASQSRSLKQTLEEWSDRAGVTLRWDSEFDYPIQASVQVEGDYETAVRTLLRGFSSAQPQPVARLFRPAQGAPGVLLVTARGNDISRGK